MDVTNTATGVTRSLTNNQKLVVNRGQIGPIEPMSQAEWDALMKRHGVESAQRARPAPPSGAIPELGAEITHVQFYEEGAEDAPFEQRTYRKLFARSQTRYICWEIRLKFPAPGRTVSFAIEAVWTAPDGRELARHTAEGTVQGNWTNSYHSWGRGGDDPGTWKPGTYVVDFFHQGRKITSGSFQVSE